MHPDTPRGGMPLQQLLGGRPLKPMQDQLANFAASFGVELGFSARIPNTRRPLAMAEFARLQGRLEPFRDAVMDAHWQEARDIEDAGVLRSLAEKAGLDPEDALAAADGREMQARVDGLGVEARRWGVTGIPTYFLLPEGWEPGSALPASGARPVKIVGCQPFESLLGGCAQAQVRRRGVAT